MSIAVLTPNWLGDLVMAAPAIRHLVRAVQPGRLLVLAPAALAPLARLIAPTSEVMGFERRKGLAGLKDRLRLAGLVRSLGVKRFVLLPNSFSSALVAFLAGSKARIGTAMHGRAFLLTHRVEVLREFEHQADAYMRVAASALGEKNPPTDTVADTDIEVPRGLVLRAAELLRGHGLEEGDRFLVLAPGAAYGPAKHYGPENFAKVAELARGLGLRVVIVGTASDRPEAICIIARLATDEPSVAPIDLTGKTDLAELAGVLALASGFIGNDSGAAHLAAAVGTPTVVLFLSTDPVRTAPRGKRVRVLAAPLECRPCMARTCRLGNYACRESISPQETIKALTEIQY